MNLFISKETVNINQFIPGTAIKLRVESIESIAACLYGDDLKETVIQKMASELYKVKYYLSKLEMLIVFLLCFSGDNHHYEPGADNRTERVSPGGNHAYQWSLRSH